MRAADDRAFMELSVSKTLLAEAQQVSGAELHALRARVNGDPFWEKPHRSN